MNGMSWNVGVDVVWEDLGDDIWGGVIIERDSSKNGTTEQINATVIFHF